jgi:hypothetical protein
VGADEGDSSLNDLQGIFEGGKTWARQRCDG